MVAGERLTACVVPWGLVLGANNAHIGCEEDQVHDALPTLPGVVDTTNGIRLREETEGGKVGAPVYRGITGTLLP